MINALARLNKQAAPAVLPESMEAFGISGRYGSGLKRLFMSHPPIAERIAALEQLH
jgi:heat shock protein HtpX